ncbi:hypothetical protein ABZ532_24320 [Streptomyces sp. NPDC019396]|uniref:hypothetical protein n=1 Tax=Streptomyces sp. NPDC019396 TaxID=3154687 RepID=UPI0033C78E7D
MENDVVRIVETSTDTVLVPTIAVGDAPIGVVMIPNGTKAYVANSATAPPP